jgi:hypothetical protein
MYKILVPFLCIGIISQIGVNAIIWASNFGCVYYKWKKTRHKDLISERLGCYLQVQKLRMNLSSIKASPG